MLHTTTPNRLGVQDKRDRRRCNYFQAAALDPKIDLVYTMPLPRDSRSLGLQLNTDPGCVKMRFVICTWAFPETGTAAVGP